MKALITVLAVLVVLGLGLALYRSPSAPLAMTDAQRAETAAEVDSVTSEWWAVWSAAEDFDRLMDFYADDLETLWIGDGVASFGRGEIDGGFRSVMENMQRQDNKPVEWRTIVLAPDIAYTVRINDITQTDLAGNPRPTHRYAETLVWVKRDGEWKVLIGHGSTPNESM